MTLPVRNNRIRLPQGQIFWREVGQGQSVVFLHGAWWTGEQWDKVVPHLSRDYHCVVPDLLGFGESGRPKTHYSIQLEVECLAAYLRFLRIKRCVMVADGLGAWVAAAFALAQ
jgi:pimeloyl-ACP methyl ester carboxylesterase